MTHVVPSLPFPFEPETTVVDDRFVIKSELGQGGMGRCYRVLQKNLDRVCVLKMLAPKLHPRFVAHTDARALLENEAKILGQLASGNDSFVQVFDRGTLFARVRRERQELELDLPYYVMEYLQGQSVEVIIDGAAARQTMLPIASVISLCQQAARGLCIAHGRGVIHRDVKPDNMFLQERVDRLPTLKLIDFGVSTREGAPHVHGTGTMRYGAPELLSKRVTRESTQSDMYPLGLVFYELAALRGPHVCNSKEEYMLAHVYGEAPDVRQFRQDCPVQFAGLLKCLLSKDPAARPTAKQTDDELTTILATLAGGGTAQAQLSHLLPSPGERAARRERSARTGSGRLHGATLSGSAVGGPVHSSQYFSRPAVDSQPQSLRERTQPLGCAHTPASQSPSALMKRDTLRDVPQPPMVGLPPILVTESIIVDKPGLLRRPSEPIASTLEAADAGGIEDIPYVPVFRSMGQIFDAIWEDDTRYQPSLFDTGEMPIVRGDVENAFFSRGETISPVAQNARVDDGQSSPRVPRTGRRRAVHITVIGVSACLLLTVGLRVVSWGRTGQASEPPAAPQVPTTIPTAAPATGAVAPVEVAAGGSWSALQMPESPAFDAGSPEPSATASAGGVSNVLAHTGTGPAPGSLIAAAPHARLAPSLRASGAHQGASAIYEDYDPFLSPPKSPASVRPSTQTSALPTKR
jgi:serine/threonine protein kinase